MHVPAAIGCDLLSHHMCPAPLSQALEIAKYQYYAAGKRAGRKLKRFDPSELAAELEEIGHDNSLVGWTLIPRNMMKNEDGTGGREIFHPVDALDCAAFRGKGPRATAIPTPTLIPTPTPTHTRTHTLACAHTPTRRPT